MAACIWFILPTAWYAKEKFEVQKYLEEKSDLHFVRQIKNKIIFNNYYEINEAFKTRILTQQIIESPPDFSSIQNLNLSKVENIIVVVGESARKQNMSFYGYKRETTPNADSERENMLWFENAVSPSAFTYHAVSLTLSAIPFKDYENQKFKKINNNIISIGQHSGYPSIWITHRASKEEYFLTHYSNQLVEVRGRYDTLLLNENFNQQMMEKGNKLTVLHLIGSHMEAKTNYPSTHNFFKGNNSLDEYDNSIRYTDYFLGKLFNQFRNTNTAIIYYSDHGQKFNYNRFFHSESQEANRVPLFIWYGNQVPKDQRITGKIKEETSTRIVYDLVLRLMNLENTNSESHSPAKFIENGKVIYFKNLKD